MDVPGRIVTLSTLHCLNLDASEIVKYIGEQQDSQVSIPTTPAGDWKTVSAADVASVYCDPTNPHNAHYLHPELVFKDAQGNMAMTPLPNTEYQNTL